MNMVSATCTGTGIGAFVTALPTRYAFAGTEFHVLQPRHAIDKTFLSPPEGKTMLSVMVGEMTRGEIQKKLELKDEKHFRENNLQVAVKLGLIELTIPDKPRSSKHRYRITRLGKRILEQNTNGGEKVKRNGSHLDHIVIRS